MRRLYPVYVARVQAQHQMNDYLLLTTTNKNGSGIGRETRLSDRIVLAAQDTSPVTGLTHNFYRYPARFSPVFVRSVIETFSNPGDWVIDPFVGGGTTLVEAMALGRNALGIDISSLAAFICKAKTLVITDQETTEYERWRSCIPKTINMHAPASRFKHYADAGYYRNIEGNEFWRLRKATEQALVTVERLQLPGTEILARCTVLRTAQWALDARKTRPSIPTFRDKMSYLAKEMIESAKVFRERWGKLSINARPRVFCLNRSTAGAHTEALVRMVSPPKLIVTSPPYPGIHVLYHRWQVDGRREAPAPFWIAGAWDGTGASHYTMGDRKNPKLRSYFENLEASFSSVAAIAGPETKIVQLVAFSEVDWQLPQYLEVMERCGLIEERRWGQIEGDGRLWRDVPNRKWYAIQKSRSPGAREVVLVHRRSG